ncbi:uncharacterized protein BJ212DRAFT_1306649 [Suillus subaureus]|uniref:Uncharacterized protein n=1 Tax=Suillus subaureus TaxID=48587 RepID=A0A9P7DIP3_9AGAM|nr:uncharacterized protein BJ212DRAFT_1306649 [Suillus subaureus]KAG1795238.1 hypothetical protein BJ212DRAFT_1306649 [Suillus subaureus]
MSFSAQFTQPQHFNHDDGTSYDGYTYDQDRFRDMGDQPYDGSSLTNPQPNFSQPHDDGTSYDRYTYNQDRFGDTGDQPYDGSSLTNPQPNFLQPQDDSTSYDRYPYDQDRFRDTGDQPCNGSSLTMPRGPQEGTHVHGTPLLPWVDEAPNGGVSVVDQGTGFIPLATNLALIWQGEIPRGEVVHTRGPARTMRKCNTRADLPGTPYLILQAPHSTTELQTRATSSQAHTTALQTPIAAEHLAATLKTGAKVLIARVIFTKHTMTQKRKKHIAQFEDTIKDSTPCCLEVGVVIENFITNVHRRQVLNTLSNICGKIAQFSHDSVFVSYKLFPPQGWIDTAEKYCITMVSKLIWGTDPLLFMHAYSVDEKQRSTVITIDAFGGQHHEEKFKEIVQAFDTLVNEEKFEFNSYLQYVLDVRPSQAGNGESSSDSK